MQYCQICGKERHPKSKPGVCQECKVAENRKTTSQKYFDKLTELGYIVHTPKEELWDKIKKFDVTNKECGHRFTAQGGNILQQLSKCAVCGPRKRMDNALVAYKRRYGRTYDLNKRDDYTKAVRGLSNKNFIGTKLKSQHLDHKISIDWGFKNGAPIEMIADPDNLEVLSATDNIKKGNRIYDFELLNKLCQRYNFPLTLINTDTLNPSITELIKRLPTIFTSIDVKHGILNTPFFNVKIVAPGDTCSTNHGDISIFEDEIENSSNTDRRLRIIVERLIHKAQMHRYKIFARKCKVVEITSVDATRFLNCYHFQGAGKSRIKLGLYYDDDLVAVMTFGKPRFAKGYDWELIRYATKSDCVIVGGASKLLSYFRKQYTGSIVTYSDRRWGDGAVYGAIGFKKISTSKPNYWWIKNGRRISRYETQLKMLPELLGPSFKPELSEKDNMLNNGWTMIQDLGNDVFAME